MTKNSPVFVRVKEHRLYLDLVLVEFQYPILFTCLDEENNMYIATCFHTDAKEKEWLIADTEPERVRELLRNEITIRDIFPAGGGTVYLAAKNRGMEHPQVKEYRASGVPEEIFPTPGMFMDADDDEFQEEISVLERRIEAKKARIMYCYSEKRQVADFRWFYRGDSRADWVAALSGSLDFFPTEKGQQIFRSNFSLSSGRQQECLYERV